MNTLARGCVAEFLGTFALCFFGIGSIVITQDSVGAGSLVTVALAHGMALVIFVTGCMYVSGAQFNPAVSLGLFSIGKQGIGQTMAFIATQLVAAACATGIIVATLGRGMTDPVHVGATVGSLTEAGGTGEILALEAIMTFALMFVILSAVVDERAHKLGGFMVGLTVVTCIVGFGPLTGASMNPSRSFGPAMYAWDSYNGLFWVYVVAPIAGALAAAWVYKLVWEKGGVEAPESPAVPLHEGDPTRKHA
ncbi:MAG: aquaporin [Phycisphaerales bacterium]